MNMVFVFGSNSMGNHGAGAAKTALDHYGAVMGEGNGLHGNSYAIDTMSGWNHLVDNVNEFINYAKANPRMSFYVTPIGCGIAGYNTYDIAPLFEDAPFNVALCMDLVCALSPETVCGGE